MKSSRAFTLIELLTVMAIIAILAILVSVAAGPFIRTAQMTQGMNNMKQLGSGLALYTGSHDGELPLAGSQHPSFGSASGADEVDAWYNAVPKLAGGRALSDFTNAKDFYTKSNLLFVPAAKYPSGPQGVLFAIAMNARLHLQGTTDSSVRLANFQAPSRTIVFLETGIPGEEALPGQGDSNYDGGSAGRPNNLAARYRRPSSKSDSNALREAGTNLLFADGHAESLQVKDVISSAGTAYFPQLGQGGQQGKVCWTLDPESNPN